MIGAIFGDVVGSIYEFDNHRSKDFELFGKKCSFTDDTVMSVALAEALMRIGEDASDLQIKNEIINAFHKYGAIYPYAGYGARFKRWLVRGEREPYMSYGNGSAMRVSPVIWFAKSIEETARLARLSAEVTHNHKEGIKGAVVTAVAGYMARTGSSKEQIRDYIKESYNINFTLDEIRPTYEFNETCQDTVPQAMVAFLEGDSLEDTIRNGVSIGGDTDTLCAIAGAVAEAYFGVPDDIKGKTLSYLNPHLLGVVNDFYKRYVK